MLTKIRRLKVKQAIDGMLDEGEILYEYINIPNHFYSKNKEHNDFFNLEVMCGYVDFDTWFEELRPIKKEKSPEYKLLLNNNSI